MRLAFGTDEATSVTKAICDHLINAGHEVVNAADVDLLPWPTAGRRVAEMVVSGAADMGIVCCWTGTGVSIAANKVQGIRAALCTDAETARSARRWNDANVLAIGLRLTTETVAIEMLDAFLGTDADPDELDLIAELEPATEQTDRFSL